ncbi:hypothetical protein VTO42DRAFT_7365 [Malbranchea cinnamomea]
MKFQTSLSLTAVLCTLPSALAAWTNLTLSDYQLKQSGASDIIADLDGVLPVKKVKDVIADTNHKNPASSPKVTNLIKAFTWEDVDGYDDAHTQKWYPQGITTSADAYGSGEYDGDVVTLVSWHSDKYDGGKRGARISFVNRNNAASLAYRNALLIELTRDSNGTPNFKAIPKLHAGGIFWYGNLLYVVETRKGIRVFDLEHIYQVNTGDGIGKVGNTYQAFGYKYVIPQVRSYSWVSKDGIKDFRFSFVALDRTSTPDSIIVGEYNTDAPNRLVHFDIDYTNRLLKTNANGIATATRAVSHTHTKIQGAVTINDKYFLTQSGGSLITFSWSNGEKVNSGVFPSVPEDLSYQAGYGLWSLMEMPGYRHVVAIDHTKF